MSDDIDRRFCIIYTSGTTGVPKGVCLPHRGYSSVLYYRTKVRFRAGDFTCSPLTSPWHFDGSIVQMFSPWITGGRLVIRGSIHDLGSSAAYHRLTALTGASTLIAELIRTYGVPGQARVVGLGAEPVPPDLLELLKASGNFRRLLTGYGVTECSCYSTDHVLYDRDEEHARRDIRAGGMSTSSIGGPITNTQIYLLDKQRRLLPSGAVGEIYLGGIGVAQGYLNRPELNADRFISDPFQPTAGSRCYRTGDLGRWKDDGTLEFLGRIDKQIKLRGYRIEPGEIETAINEYPTIQQAVVMLRDDLQAEKRLVAYCVAPAPETIDRMELRRQLSLKLPSYMVPDAILVLPNLPLTSGGKIDFSKLPAPSERESSPERPHSAPRTNTEKQLVSLWQELLGISNIGIKDSFFEFGGDSLLAVKLFAAIKQNLGKSLPLVLLYTESTIEQLSRRIDTQEQPRPIASLIPMQPKGSGKPLFVMPSLFGETLFAKPLIDAISESFPVVGLQPHFTLQYESIFADFRRTAFEYSEVLRREFPGGPYCLLGYSYGGYLAFEVARQLRLQNEQIGLLAIIDTGPERLFQKKDSLARLSHWANVVRNAPRWLFENMEPAALKRLWHFALEKMRKRRKHSGDSSSNPVRLDDVFETQQVTTDNLRILDNAFASFQSYIPERYDGSITLFRAHARPLLHSFSRDLGWLKVATDVITRNVAGDHQKIITSPNVESIAHVLIELMNGREPRL